MTAPDLTTADPRTILVVGAGVCGVTAALELRRRGHVVHLFDPGPLPHPEAASTDISKVLRMDYGSDEFYWDMMLEAFAGWEEWNARFERPLWHRTGFLMLSRDNWRPGGFEYDSCQVAMKRGLPIQPIDRETLAARYPAWRAENYPQGYFNPQAGWAESGEVVRRLVQECQVAGVVLHEGVRFQQPLENGSRVGGFMAESGERFEGDILIVAAGAWTPALLPHLSEVMWATGQPVFHFRAPANGNFRPPHFPVWNADIANTGWYGFPALEDGTLKVANHGPGWRVDPHAPRRIPGGTEEKFRTFFRDTFPDLVDAPKLFERLCLYCDTWDGNFWIDYDPQREGLLVCAGDSGHGFKFAPLLGRITTDVVEGRPNPYAPRFSWRAPGRPSHEEARFPGHPDDPRRQ